MDFESSLLSKDATRVWAALTEAVFKSSSKAYHKYILGGAGDNSLRALIIFDFLGILL